MVRVLRRSLLLSIVLSGRVAVAIAEEAEKDSLDDCVGGICPIKKGATAAQDIEDIDMDEESESECGMWLGPSPIKEVEEQGFGLGMFTGRHIPKGSLVELEFYGTELVIPIFDSKILDEDHPPLREYVWNGDNMPEIPLEIMDGSSYLFMPGAAAIVPCTSKNYNMVFTGQGELHETVTLRHDVASESGGIHRSRDPTAGSFSNRHNASYTAVRDIVPGEELTVQCTDDDFDGGAYFLSRFSKDDNAVMCLDNNIRVDESTVAKVGKGLFAKQPLEKGSIITSTPLIPMHRDEMVVDKDDDDDDDDLDLPSKQLLMNYCYGHPNSDLLLLPFGPMVNYLNHPPSDKAANAEIRWHDNQSPTHSNEVLSRRQQYHHPELLDLPANTVAKTHGKGLMMDIVALRHIEPNEEIFIDYGNDWNQAWNSHVRGYKGQEETYVSLSDFERMNRNVPFVRTEAEQASNPYPSNLQTACFFDEPDAYKNSGNDVDTVPWSTVAGSTACLRSCTVLDRYENDGIVSYTARMSSDEEETSNARLCELSHSYIATNIPQRALRILDRPYTSDFFLPNAFRHEIGVPDGFFPEAWMRKRVRRQDQPPSDDGDLFKRKQTATS